MFVRNLLLIIIAFASSASLRAEKLAVIESDCIYPVYGMQVKSDDFTDYRAVVSYYHTDSTSHMILRIEQPENPSTAIVLSINPDGWQTATTDDGPASVYHAPDGQFDMVVMAINDKDALLTLSRKKKPTVSYLISRIPI